MPDTRFARFVLMINAAVPLAILGWDAANHQLGADPTNYAIHTTGWLALMFLTLSMLVTPFRKLTGLSWLVQFRRTIGLYGFVYAAIHLSIYFCWDRGGSISATWKEVQSKPFITYGAAALFMLTPLALTSTNGMIRRLGPKRWAWLHTLVYPATASAAVHYWLEGKVVTWDKQMFLYTVAALLGYRWIARLVARDKPVVAPPVVAAAPKQRKFWRGQLKIARIFRETPTVQTFRLVSPDGGPRPFDFLPGQYLNLSLMIDGRKVPRSYTIASSPSRRDYCEITVKREEMGVCSRYLHDSQLEGQLLSVSAPAGRFTFTGKEADGIVLIAGGVGITPLMSILRYLTDHAWAGPIDLFFSIRSESEIIFRQEIEYLAQRCANFHPHICVTRDASAEWAGLRGRITGELLQRYVSDLPQRLTYVCGPAAMLDPMRQLLITLGVPEERIKYEEFFSPAGGGEGSAVAEMPPAEVEFSTTATDDSATATLTFARSGRTVPLPASQVILEAAEDAGISIPFECRSGICGTCKTRLLAGQVMMETTDALTPADRAAGYVLACQARSAGDVSVEA